MPTLTGPSATASPETLPLVSVVVPNYNYARFLPQALDSVFAQTFESLEVIVVDDGSTDGSEAVLRGYGDRLRWYRQQNQGVSAARNRGIRESRGEFIAFLDADDLWLPEKLARQVELLRKSPAVGMVYTGIEYINATGEPVGTRLTGRRGKVLRDLALMRGPGVPASGSSALIRKESLDRVGLFDTELSTSADWDMWRRISCHYEIEIIRDPLIRYRLHGSSMHRNVDRFERDMLRAFSSMFADPAAKEVHAFRRRCYGNLYATLAGSYLHAGQWHKSLECAGRAVIHWPYNVTYLASFPVRRALRRLGVQLDDPDVV